MYQPEPCGRRRCQRLALPARPRAPRPAARLRRSDHPHPRRDVAHGRPDRDRVPCRDRRDHGIAPRGGSRALLQRRVRPRHHRRRVLPGERVDATEAQPVRATRDPRRRRHAAWPRDRRPRHPAHALRPHGQPALRVRRGHQRRRARHPRDRPRRRGRGEPDLPRPRAPAADVRRRRRRGAHPTARTRLPDRLQHRRQGAGRARRAQRAHARRLRPHAVHANTRRPRHPHRHRRRRARTDSTRCSTTRPRRSPPRRAP